MLSHLSYPDKCFLWANLLLIQSWNIKGHSLHTYVKNKHTIWCLVDDERKLQVTSSMLLTQEMKLRSSITVAVSHQHRSHRAPALLSQWKAAQSLLLLVRAVKKRRWVSRTTHASRSIGLWILIWKGKQSNIMGKKMWKDAAMLTSCI